MKITWLTSSGLAILLLAMVHPLRVHGKILTHCEAAKELEKAGVSRTFISNWICLMDSESGMNTQLVTGPKTASSYYYGIFQIRSSKWCARGHRGGLCNKRCEDFIDDNIVDDIACALKVFNKEGFKSWDGWTRNCKNKPSSMLPNVSQCWRKRRQVTVTE